MTLATGKRVSFGPMGLEYHFRKCFDWASYFEDERLQTILDFPNSN